MKERCMMATFALLFALPVNAQIYRCEVDGTIEFSDRPCSPDAAAYTQARGVSFVTPDENLPAIRQAAQAFIRERRERMAQSRAARQPPAPRRAEAAGTRTETVFVPWPSVHSRHHRKPPHRARPDHGNAPPAIAGNDRYSPLNGPILGTRPESAVFDPRSRPKQRSDQNH